MTDFRQRSLVRVLLTVCMRITPGVDVFDSISHLAILSREIPLVVVLLLAHLDRGLERGLDVVEIPAQAVQDAALL